MQQSLSEYVEAYNTLAQLQKTLDAMNAEGATLEDAVVEEEGNATDSLLAFEMQAQEFKKAQEDFSDYMDRLQDDIALKAEQFGHIEFYDARLQDGYSNAMAVAADEVQELDDRRKPLAATNPLLAKESVMLPEPNVEDVTYEHLSLNLPAIAVNALDAVSRIALEAEESDDEEYDEDLEDIDDDFEEEDMEDIDDEDIDDEEEEIEDDEDFEEDEEEEEEEDDEDEEDEDEEDEDEEDEDEEDEYEDEEDEDEEDEDDDEDLEDIDDEEEEEDDEKNQ